MASVKITANELERELAKMLEEYGEQVYRLTDEAIAEGAKVLKAELEDASPRNSGKFARNWTDTGDTYKNKIYVGNKFKVNGKNGARIPLINILEYSTTRGHPFVQATFDKSVGKVADAIIRKYKEEA